MDELNQVLNFSEEMQEPDFEKNFEASGSLPVTASGKREPGARCERQGCSPGAAAACSCHCPVTQTCHPAVTSVLTPLPLTVLFSVGKLGENWFLSVALAMRTSDISFPARPLLCK